MVQAVAKSMVVNRLTTESCISARAGYFSAPAQALSKTFGEGNTIAHRRQDLAGKVLDLQEKVTPKNMADVVLSVLWLDEVDKEGVYAFERRLALKLCDVAADGYWHVSGGDIGTQFCGAIRERLQELEDRLHTTGTTKSKGF